MSIANRIVARKPSKNGSLRIDLPVAGLETPETNGHAVAIGRPVVAPSAFRVPVSVPKKTIGSPEPGSKFPEIPLGFGAITCQLVEITPELAAQFLTKMDSDVQRNEAKKHVNKLIYDMINGLFMINGETISFNHEGRLINGRHRLAAVVASGVPIWTLVVRGLSPDCFPSIDGSRVRNSGDIVRSKGGKNTVATGCAYRLLWNYENGTILKQRPATNSTVDKMIDRHPMLMDSARFAVSIDNICQGPTVPMFCHYLFSTYDKADADRFFDVLASGAGLSKGDPVHTLRERLIREKLDQTDKIAFFFKAWNAYRLGKKMSKLGFNSKKEDLPELI